MKKKTPYAYCICRIDKKYWKTINEDLQEKGYSNIKCFVPTFQILRKSKNNKDIFEDVPMLFNYGFIKMRSKEAYDRYFLNKLRKDIPGILSFMKSLNYMHPKKLRKRVDNAEDFDDFSKVATISKEQFKYYKKLSKQNRVYSLNDIQPNAGDYVTLKKYPFEGLLAKILDFNYINQTALVEVYPGQGSVLSLQLPFSNVVYTIYDDFDENHLLVNDSTNINSLSEEEEEGLLDENN